MTMHSEVYWTMKNGQKIKVGDMDITHLRNTLKMLIKNQKTIVVTKPRPRPYFELNGDIAQMSIDAEIDNDLFEMQADDDDIWYQHGYHY